MSQQNRDEEAAIMSDTKRGFKVLIVLLAWLSALALCWHLAAATYYVDGAGGNDANNGTAVGTPWRHVPGDSAATGVSASASISGGSTIYMKGGVVYALGSSPSGIVIDSSHYNTGIGVTIASGTAIGWGFGNPVIDGASAGKVFFQVLNMSNVTLRGIEGRNSVLHNSSGAVFFYNSSYCTADGLVIHDCNTNENSQVDGIEISGSTGGYNTVTNCAVWNTTEKDIEVTGGTTHNLIINNRCGRTCDHGICIGASFNTIVGNTVSNVASGSAVYLRPTAEPGYGIKIGSNGPNYPASANIVYNNIIRDCPNGGFDIEAVGSAGAVGGNKFFNNTMINCDTVPGGSGAHGLARLIATSGSVNSSLIQNNLFCTTASVSAFLPDGPYVGANGYQHIGDNNLFSHNLWFSSAAPMKALIVLGGTQTPSLANFADTGSTSPDYRFKVASYGSGNSFAPGQLFNIDPLFTSYPSDLTLSAASPARAAGTNLSAYFTTDIRGLTRSNWSLGAYEFGGSVVPVPPQQLPPPVLSGSGTLVLSWDGVAGANSYRLFRAVGPSAFAWDSTYTSTNATVLVSTNDVTRFYTTAFDSTGKSAESKPSNVWTNTPVAPSPPPQLQAPTNLRGTRVQGTRLDLSWESDLTASTEVERSIFAAPFELVETVAAGTWHTSTTVRNKTDYQFRARSVRPPEVGPYSETISVYWRR